MKTPKEWATECVGRMASADALAPVSEVIEAVMTEALAEYHDMHFGAAEIVIEIGKTLEHLGCRHGEGHANTPPMMFREWLLCCVGKRKDEIKRLRAVLTDADELFEDTTMHDSPLRAAIKAALGTPPSEGKTCRPRRPSCPPEQNV